MGLLAIRPMHGYEMARYFDRDALLQVLPLEPGLLYTYVRALEERALVSGREERVGLRPPRRVLELTPEGRRLLGEWLHRPVERIREVRLDLLIKLYILRQIDSAAELELVRAQIRVCERYRDRLRRSVDSTAGFDRLVAGSKLSAAEATLSWLRSYARELASEREGAIASPA